MTFKEKLIDDYIYWTDDELNEEIEKSCPEDYGYFGKIHCGLEDYDEKKCHECWNKEIPKTCREALVVKYPNWSTGMIESFIATECPDSADIMKDPSYCTGESNWCDDCWNRGLPNNDIPGDTETITTQEIAKNDAKPVENRVSEFDSTFGDCEFCDHKQVCKFKNALVSYKNQMRDRDDNPFVVICKAWKEKSA